MRTFLATTATMALVAATPALAQTASQAPPATPNNTNAGASQSDDQSAGQVIVTARRREEAIRDVPGTITAVTGGALDARGPVTSSGDLFASVPGVRFNGLSAENLAEVAIRGSGTERATSADSGVGLFFDGAYVGSSSLGGRNFKAVDYFDVDRVEVLEGPQGALYGRNSEFGVTQIIPVKPRFDDGGYLRDMFTAGLNQNRLAAVVNHAFNDNNAVRLGVETYAQTRGFYYDPDHNRYYDSTNGWTARGQFRHRAGPLDINLLVDGQDMNLPTFVNIYNVAAGVNAALPLGLHQARFSQPHAGTDGLEQKSARSILSVSYDFGPATLESTTMATHWRSSQQFASALDVNALSKLRQLGELGIDPFAETTTDVRDTTYYQDVHLTGASHEHLTWVIGAEYLNQRDTYNRTAATAPCAFTLTASLCTGTPTNPICVKPLATSLVCPTPFPLAFGVYSHTRQRSDSAAAYASLQYTLGDLSLVGEARYSDDKKSADQANYRLYTTTLSNPASSFDFNASQWTWTFTASYKLPVFQQTLVYAKAGTGYRAGGVNSGTFNAAAPNPFVQTYGNESTLGYETGVKANITRNVFLRLSGYISTTDNAITSINDGCTLTNACLSVQQFFNVNGGTIRAEGVELALDSRFHAAGGLLTLNLNAASQRAKFIHVPAGGGGLPFLNSPVAQIPHSTFSGTIDYRHEITTDLIGFGNISYSAQHGGGQDTVTVATPYIPMDNYDLFSTRFGVDYRNMEFAAFVRNAGDQNIQVLKFYQGTAPLAARWNQPRTFGVSASYRW